MKSTAYYRMCFFLRHNSGWLPLIRIFVKSRRWMWIWRRWIWIRGEFRDERRWLTGSVLFYSGFESYRNQKKIRVHSKIYRRFKQLTFMTEKSIYEHFAIDRRSFPTTAESFKTNPGVGVTLKCLEHYSIHTHIHTLYLFIYSIIRIMINKTCRKNQFVDSWKSWGKRETIKCSFYL